MPLTFDVRVNSAIVNLRRPQRAFNIKNRLSDRMSTVRLEIEGEETWAAPNLAAIKASGVLGLIHPSTKDPITIIGDSTKFFAGTIGSVGYKKVGLKRVYALLGQDYNIQLHSILVDKSYTAQTEQQIIDDLFDTYWSEVDTTTHVDGTNTVASIEFPRVLLDNVLDQLALLYGKEWYIDYDKKLHYFAVADNAAALEMRDDTFDGTKKPYFNFAHQEDSTRIINRITVVGEKGGSYDPTVAKYFNGGYTSYLDEVTDGDIATHLQADNMGVANYIYIGMAEPCNEISIQMGTNKNANASVLTAEYSQGAASWGSVTITDGTDKAGDTLAKSGKITFTKPSDFAKDTVDGVEAFYIRLDVSAALSAAVDIAGISVNRHIVVVRSDSTSYALFNDTWYDGKHVDANINTEVWAELVGDAILTRQAYNKIDGKLTTEEYDLTIGEYLHVVNALRGIDDYYTIQATNLGIIGGTIVRMDVNYGSSREDLIELLMRIQASQLRE